METGKWPGNTSDKMRLTSRGMPAVDSRAGGASIGACMGCNGQKDCLRPTNAKLPALALKQFRFKAKRNTVTLRLLPICMVNLHYTKART